jgi:hypothetical protein
MRAFLNRPDHLTRTALELSRRGEVEKMASNLSYSDKIIVTNVSIGTREQPALLVTREVAARATQAIHETVALVRDAQRRTTSDP